MQFLNRSRIVAPSVGVMEAHRFDVGQVGRIPGDPFRSLVSFVSQHSGLPADVDPRVLQRLLPHLNVNLYETRDSGEPRLMHLGSNMPLFRDDGRRGQPLREVPAPPSFMDMIASQVDLVAATGLSALHHISTSYNGHAYHRILMPVGQGSRIGRVVSFVMFPSPLAAW